MTLLTIPPVGSAEDAKAALAEIGLRNVSEPRLAEKQGLVNTVYLVATEGEGLLAVKVNRDPLVSEIFKKEKVCAERAKSAGIPTPEVLATGRTETAFFIVSRGVVGRNAGIFGEQEVLSVFRKLGEWARCLHTIPCDGFGCSASNIIAPVGGARGVSWLDWCESEQRFLIEEPEYERRGVLRDVDVARFEEVFGYLRLLSISKEAVLGHGDLSHENVMVGEGDINVLLDWGSALGCTGLPFELAPVSMWQSEVRRTAFLEGYGLLPHQYAAQLYPIRLIKVWYGLRMLQWMTSASYVLRRGIDPDRVARIMRICDPWIDECLSGPD